MKVSIQTTLTWVGLALLAVLPMLTPLTAWGVQVLAGLVVAVMLWLTVFARTPYGRLLLLVRMALGSAALAAFALAVRAYHGGIGGHMYWSLPLGFVGLGFVALAAEPWASAATRRAVWGGGWMCLLLAAWFGVFAMIPSGHGHNFTAMAPMVISPFTRIFGRRAKKPAPDGSLLESWVERRQHNAVQTLSA